MSRMCLGGDQKGDRAQGSTCKGSQLTAIAMFAIASSFSKSIVGLLEELCRTEARDLLGRILRNIT